ncbi:MAG: murein biosynthesis integral membrane protein MurJ [Deltaproteobacteria bacterium]|nr:murein biosynthesis integral membrane protein MurJ [Deltaproteobacteria bacterium]
MAKSGSSGATVASTGPSVARHASTVSLYTMLSRVLGLVRDTIFAHLFGVTNATDAFLMAFTIPNTFRMLVAEGSLTVAFLPVFNEAQRKGGEDKARQVMSEALGVFPVLSVGLALLCILGAEPIVRVFASGYGAVPGKLELTVFLTRTMFPFMALISMVALAMGALNARKRFASSAASPALFNLIHILSMVTLARVVDPPMLGVALGVLLGGGAQLTLQLVALYRAGLLVRPRFVLGPEVRRVLWLMLPAVAALAVYQLNVAALRLFTSYLGEGALTYLYNADRFLQLPLGVFAIAIATASLPAFSDASATADSKGLIAALGDSLRLMSFVTVPAAAGQIALALPIIATVFQHGRFDAESAVRTAAALVAFNVGLVAVSGIRVVGQAFFAIKDTRTPVAAGAIGLFTNLALAPFLAERLGFMGLALSVSLSAWVQLLTQLVFLRRRLGRLGLRHVLAGVGRDLAAALLMGLAVYALSRVLGTWGQGTSAANVLALALLVALGALSYVAVQAVFRAEELSRVTGALRRRLQRSR